MDGQLSLFGFATDFIVGEEVFYVSLDNVFKAVITRVGKYVEWTCKDGTECYCISHAAKRYLFKTRVVANKEIMKYKKQFKGGK